MDVSSDTLSPFFKQTSVPSVGSAILWDSILAVTARSGRPCAILLVMAIPLRAFLACSPPQRLSHPRLIYPSSWEFLSPCNSPSHTPATTSSHVWDTSPPPEDAVQVLHDRDPSRRVPINCGVKVARLQAHPHLLLLPPPTKTKGFTTPNNCCASRVSCIALCSFPMRFPLPYLGSCLGNSIYTLRLIA